MSRRRLRMGIMFVILIFLWQLFASFLDNEILLPYPLSVLRFMLWQINDSLFYASVFQTLLRVISGFLIALSTALIVVFLSYFYPWIADSLSLLLHITRSIPNISYILIVLFWFSAQTSVIVISFFILFPTMYATLYQGLLSLPRAYQDVMKALPGTKRFDIVHVYLPYLRPFLLSSTSAGLSLALKVGIMAEILGQVRIGIGRQLNICRMNLDMAGVFAWTIWIMVLLFFMEQMISFLFQLYHKHEG